MLATSTPSQQTQRITFLERLHSPERPVLVFDGATGTSLQLLNLTAEDFGGAALEGCNEQLVFTRPNAVQTVHRHFLEAGCDVIETDTFGATSIVLAEYGLEDQAFTMNKRAAELAREMADAYSTPEKPRFVAGSLGPPGTWIWRQPTWAACAAACRQRVSSSARQGAVRDFK